MSGGHVVGTVATDNAQTRRIQTYSSPQPRHSKLLEYACSRVFDITDLITRVESTKL